MPKNADSRRSIRFVKLGLVSMAAILAFAVTAGATDPADILEDPVWVGLGTTLEYTRLCQQDEMGIWICHDTCPPGSSSICAELTTPGGDILRTCCIPLDDLGTSNPFACLFEVQLVRDGEVPEEIHWN